MKGINLLFIIFSLGLHSCFIADELFLEENSPSPSLDSKVQNVISTHIKANSENYIYKNYGFSELIIKKPAELVVLDNLKRKKRTDLNQKAIDQKIQQLDSIIKQNNITYSLEIDHQFSLKQNVTNSIELFEMRFILSDSISINQRIPLSFLNLTPTEAITFQDYFYENSIFSHHSFEESKALSTDFYNFMKHHQEELIGIKDKSEFLRHTLTLCNEIKSKGKFDQHQYLLNIAKNKFNSDTTIIGYAPIMYSNLFETIIDQKLVNYYFTHSFTNSKTGFPDTLFSKIEFTPYYELKSISPTSKTDNPHIND